MVRVCGVGSLVGAPASAPTNTRGIRTDSGACVGRRMLLEDAGELRRPEPQSRTEEIARRVNEPPYYQRTREHDPGRDGDDLVERDLALHDFAGDVNEDASKREFCGDTKSETLRFATAMTYGCVCNGFPQATSTAHPCYRARADAPSPLPSLRFPRGTIPHRSITGGRR
jgi:hypothetical protein